MERSRCGIGCTFYFLTQDLLFKERCLFPLSNSSSVSRLPNNAPQVDGTESARITVKGSEDESNRGSVILRGAGTSNYVFEIKHDYYIIEVPVLALAHDVLMNIYVGIILKPSLRRGAVRRSC